MNINEWINIYHSMIVEPININGKMGFHLTNSMRILFDDTSLTKKSVQILKKHYERLSL